MTIAQYQIPPVNPRIISPKEARIIGALLVSPHTRLQLDAVANTSGSPEYVSRLRSRGLVIHTQRFKVITIDGVSYPGCYTLHPNSHQFARELLAGAEL